MSLFHDLLYQPIFNILVVIYNTIAFHDFGISVVVLTAGVRLSFMPLSIKTIVSQRAMVKVQPKLKELQEKYKDDKQALAQATMALYKEYKVNPFSGCLPLLIQIPVLIALYRALNAAFKPENLADLYKFVTNPGVINHISLGFIDLSHKSPLLAITAGALQFLQARQSMSLQTAQSQGDKDSPMAIMNKQMLYFFPLMVIVISWNLPTGIVLYWITTTLFSLAEQVYIRKRHT